MEMNESDVPKYKKKKSQESKSEKRSDHKHAYEKSILLYIDSDGIVNWANWSQHCSICGRLKSIDHWNVDEFRKTEFQGRSRGFFLNDYLSLDDIFKKFPNVPIYRNNPNEIFGKDVRLR